MSVPTNCGFCYSVERSITVRSGNIWGSPCAVNRPIDIIQKRRRFDVENDCRWAAAPGPQASPGSGPIHRPTSSQPAAGISLTA
ncbi:cAMP-specific 3',5'-cyclic phosphodiesterase 4D-like isoform X7 [Lates japonicus]|uniref:cAMP-specific 3',5'-cyclic phosphodiesterase 4D-like isoform X7 n=1 Tax=Lates japonicus TaxID=270547 RepID=A0AAD3NFA3_LATJO|nr:cAMP-specific 3',5'-cyclic phosphodiesterase 4D-like isoform X7 [Lates japonicus]